MKTIKEARKSELKIFEIIEHYYIDDEFTGEKYVYTAQLDNTEIAREDSFSELIKSLEEYM